MSLPPSKRVCLVDFKVADFATFAHPGARLVTTVANRLIREDGKFGLIAACADGGIGHGCIIERHPDAKL